MSDAPPSYESIVQSMKDKTDGKTITFEQLSAFAQSLSPSEKATIAACPPVDPKTLDPAEVDAFKQKIQNDLLSPDAMEKFKKAANDAVVSCKAIDDMFISLYALIAKIDNDNNLTGTDSFLPTFGAIQVAWRQTLRDSRTLAIDVAVYAKGFGDSVLGPATDPKMSQDDKLKCLQIAQQGTEGYNTRAQNIETALEGIVSSFSIFESKFGTWGATKEGELNKDLEQAKSDLASLLSTASTLRGQMIGFGVAVGVGALLAVGGCFAGPAAPIFWVAGGLIMLAFGTVLLATGIQYKNTMDDIDAKQAQIDTLQKEVADIESARAKLLAAGKSDVAYIGAHIGAVTGVWTVLESDTQAIKDWIQKGCNYESSSLPPIIKLHMIQDQLAQAVALYDKVGEYMSDYAEGMLSSGIPGVN